MKKPPPSYQRHRFPSEIISHAVWLYHRFSYGQKPVWLSYYSNLGQSERVPQQVFLKLPFLQSPKTKRLFLPFYWGGISGSFTKAGTLLYKWSFLPPFSNLKEINHLSVAKFCCKRKSWINGFAICRDKVMPFVFFRGMAWKKLLPSSL